MKDLSKPEGLRLLATIVSVYVTLDLVRDHYFKLSDDPARVFQGLLVWCAIGLPMIADEHLERAPWLKRYSLYYLLMGVFWAITVLVMQRFIA